MMTLRRWLTARYDWTGLSGLLYKSPLLTIILFTVIAAAVVGYAVLQQFVRNKFWHETSI
jgi:quinone-modifying oxidoreductase subunit QmoC